MLKSSLKKTFPDVGLSKPDKIFNKVVLPEPEGPTTATAEDSSNSKLISFKISIVLLPCLKCLYRLEHLSIFLLMPKNLSRL